MQKDILIEYLAARLYEMTSDQKYKELSHAYLMFGYNYASELSEFSGLISQVYKRVTPVGKECLPMIYTGKTVRKYEEAEKWKR